MIASGFPSSPKDCIFASQHLLMIKSDSLAYNTAFTLIAKSSACSGWSSKVRENNRQYLLRAGEFRAHAYLNEASLPVLATFCPVGMQASCCQLCQVELKFGFYVKLIFKHWLKYF